MTSSTFYLKYRPQTISQLDNAEVAEKLSSYLKTGTTPHAFLLVGHKGTGKTSSARIIAKAINCEDNIFAEVPSSKSKVPKKEDYEPCNRCEICKLITEGNDPDVLEIDAASNTSVEDIRDLRDKVRFSPTLSRYKVYIIDEVHMISKSAFNALLKTLEEPPEKTVFILATTELEKVPETITSRCTLIEFKRADAKSIHKSINRIVKGEKLKITDMAINSIINISSGSFRDAAKILEQATYLSEGEEITEDIVGKITGGESVTQVFELLETILSSDTKKAISLIENLREKNVDLRAFVKQVLEVLHEILLEQVGITNDKLPITNLGKKISREFLKVIIENFEKAYVQMKFADVVELPVEMAILEILSNTNQYYPILTNTNKEKSQIPNPKLETNPKGQNSKEKTESDSVDLWKQIINKVNEESRQLAGIMRSCKFAEKGKNDFQIETTSKFHFDRLNEVKAKDLICKCACEVAGRDVKMEYILIEK